MTFSSVRTTLYSNGKFYLKEASIGPRTTTGRGYYAASTLIRRPELVEECRAVPLSSRRRSLSTKTNTNSNTQQRRNLIPTQHSSKRPPPICRDAAELQELTQELLESPVGSLFCQTAVKATPSKTDDRDNAYTVARESGELIEYLLRGYNRTISPLALCGDKGKIAADVPDPDEVSVSLEKMMDVMERYHQEGEMYLRLRHEALNYNAAAAGGANSDSSTSDDSSSDSSSSSDGEGINDFSSKPGGSRTDDPRFSFAVKDKLRVDAKEKEQRQLKLGVAKDDFAMPGVTTAMYDTILDAMACSTQVLLEENTKTGASSYLRTLEPDDLYRVAGAAWNAHGLNNQYNDEGGMFFPCTTPSMVTYNAALRGIVNLCSAATSNDERNVKIIDQGLAHGFGVYNHLTHNDHGLPKRNTASVVYLLKIIEACIPTSRTRGNMTVALWHQASMEGLVTQELIRTIKDLHADSNGPEFGIFLESLDMCLASADKNKNAKAAITPQRFARFAKKYSHSKFY